MFIALGTATHLKVSYGTACGTPSRDFTNDVKKVNCLRCRKTKVFKEKKEEQK